MKNLIAKRNLIQQKVKYMKRKIKRIQAVCIYMMLLLLLLLPQTAMAKNTEKSKTTFPVQVIHKTGDDKENFVIVIMGDGYTAGHHIGNILTVLIFTLCRQFLTSQALECMAVRVRIHIFMSKYMERHPDLPMAEMKEPKR